MDDLLTPVSTTVKRGTEPKLIVQEVSTERSLNVNLESLEDIANALKSQPSLETIRQILNRLTSDDDDFNLVVPGPVSAQIVDIIVKTTIPDFWRTWKEENKSLGRHLSRCLQNGNGLGAIASRLRPLIADCRIKKPVHDTQNSLEHLEDLLNVLEQVLDGDQTSSRIWRDINSHAQNSTQKKLMWKEYLSQTSGRILSLAAEAEDVLKERKSFWKGSWIANGNEYAAWLGRNLNTLMSDNLSIDESASAVTEALGKALGMGYVDRVTSPFVSSMVKHGSTTTFASFLRKMKVHEQRRYLNAVVFSVQKNYFDLFDGNQDSAQLQSSSTIAGVGALLHGLISNNEALQEHVVEILTRTPLTTLEDSLATRRSVLAAAARDEEKLHEVLERSIKLFGDSFYIAHTPILQQEVLAQTLAMTCGYVQRSQPMFLMMMAKSSHHVSGMSNRIGATSQRARFLGMAVGMAISKMVDKPELQLNFELEGDEAASAVWYRELTEVNDRLGTLRDLELWNRQKNKLKAVTSKAAKTSAQRKQPLMTKISGPRVVEILDDSSDEDADLIAYDKPDSDPEDDTDDPTEINRNKPTPPVYIRELIIYLRDQENYERHQLALSTAASLIRRKAAFGTEVTDHIEQLASILTGLNDNLGIPDFEIQRQQSLIAILLTKPSPMAQWFARSFFSGDYSFSQRVAMLTTLGIGARELAGLQDSSTEELVPPTPSFPSKRLPQHLHEIYAPDTNPVARITNGLTQEILSPMAADAADQLSGPNILKVRTFSSRMEVQKRRSKPVPNALAKIVADNFFFPLTGRWWINNRSSGSDSIYTSPHLLPPFLHTLALLVHASGPNTLSLPQMTREFWELLLSVRGIAMNDKGVLGALLFALLMLLQTNEDKERLANEQAKELLETQEWVRLVFEGLGAGSEEDEKIRVLAAGVLVRCQEVVEKYQRRLAGAMMNY